MEVKRTDIDQLNAEITIKVAEADYKEKVDNSLKNYRKQAKMPGFRPGMVPMGMIKKMVGAQILLEEVNRLLSDKIYSYIGEEKIEILGNPLPKQEDAQKIDWETQKEFEFTYELGLAPEVKVDVTEKDKFEKFKVKISDKMIADQITEIAKRYGKMAEVDEAVADDMLYGKFVQLEKGAIKEAGIMNGTVLNIGTIEKSKDQKKFIGAKPGDVIVCKPQNIAAHNYVAAWLGIDQKLVGSIKDEFQFTVEKVHRTEPAELNQEFFDKLYGKDVIKSEAELSDKIREEMENSFAQNSDQLFEREIQDSLIKKAKLKLPDAFMKKWLKTANEEPITDEQIESDYEQYSNGLKWQLIENKLVKSHNIQVSPEEIMEHTKGMIKQQLQGMGQNLMDETELEDTAKRVLSNQDESRKLYEQMYQSKLRAFYKDTVKIKEKDISYEDFIKLAEKKRN